MLIHHNFKYHMILFTATLFINARAATTFDYKWSSVTDLCPLKLSNVFINNGKARELECNLVKFLHSCVEQRLLSVDWRCNNSYSPTDRMTIPVRKTLGHAPVVTCQCIVKSSHGAVSRMFTITSPSSLSANDDPSITYHDFEAAIQDAFTWLPTMNTGKNENERRYLGEDATFQCLFYVQSTWLRPKVTWFFQPEFARNQNQSFLLNTSLANTNLASRYSITLKQILCAPWPVDSLCYNATLSVSDIMETDQGRYRCLVEPETKDSSNRPQSSLANDRYRLEAEFGLLPVANPMSAFYFPSDGENSQVYDLASAPPFRVYFNTNTSVCMGDNLTLYCSTGSPMVGVHLYLFKLDPKVELRPRNSAETVELLNSTLLAQYSETDNNDVIPTIEYTVITTLLKSNASDFLCLGGIDGMERLRWQFMRLTIRRCHLDELNTKPLFFASSSRLLLGLLVVPVLLILLIVIFYCCHKIYCLRNKYQGDRINNKNSKYSQPSSITIVSTQPTRKKIQIFRRSNPLYTNSPDCQQLPHHFNVDLLPTDSTISRGYSPIQKFTSANLLSRRQRARLQRGLEPPQLPGTLTGLPDIGHRQSLVSKQGDTLTGDSGVTVNSSGSNSNNRQCTFVASGGGRTFSPPNLNSFGWPSLAKSIGRTPVPSTATTTSRNTGEDQAVDTVSVRCDPEENLIEYDIPVDPDWELPRTCLKVGSKLGEGAFGVVYYGSVCLTALPDKLRARFPTTKADSEVEWDINESRMYSVAVKRLRVNFNNQELLDFIKETEMMKILGEHCHLIRLFGACTQPGGPLQAVVEYAAYGNLRDFLRARRQSRTARELAVWIHLPHAQLTRLDLVDFGLQVARGMDYLASKSVVHRDLAARNILIGDQFIVKIADFGLTRAVSDYYKKTTSGRLPIRWMSPESLFDRKYTTKSDVWSYGVLLWEIYTLGGVPYPTISTDRLLHVLRDGYRNDRPALASASVYSVMLQCWQEASESRPEFGQLVKQLEHLRHTQLLASNDKKLLQAINLPNLADNSPNTGEPTVHGKWTQVALDVASHVRHDSSSDSGMSEAKDGEEQKMLLANPAHYLAMTEQYLSPRS